MSFPFHSISAQTFVDGTGSEGAVFNTPFRLNGIGMYPGNFSGTTDWELAAAFGTPLYNEPSAYISRLALGKKFGWQYVYVRYTPGISSEFILDSGIEIVVEDSVVLDNGLETGIEYKEPFGFGYTAMINENFSAGFSIRYYEQQFTEEKPVGVYTDTISYIITETEQLKEQLWSGDLGISYKFADMLRLSLFSVNLFTAGNESENEMNEVYGLRFNRGFVLGADFTPEEALRIAVRFESGNSFTFGGGYSIAAFDGEVNGGVTVMHDRYQSPFIAAVNPALGYANDFFNITLSGMFYMSDRSGSFPLEFFQEEGVHNISHNRYAVNTVNLLTNLAFTFDGGRDFILLDVNVLSPIYPTITDSYIDHPFAEGRVLNTGSEPVTVYPSSYIELINENRIQSPAITIQPGDTADVLFYTMIDKRDLNIEKSLIGRADFVLDGEQSKAVEELQKPILINTMNSWDSRVLHLRYFVKAGFETTQSLAKQILNEHKARLDTVPKAARDFMKIQILFEELAGDMLYVADSRASAETVQFPEQTLELKGGDCDDFSVLFAGIYESIGIPCAFVDYRYDENLRHVNLLINTGLKPLEAGLITNNEKKYFIRKNEKDEDRVWIPLEVTQFSSFREAWNAGAELFTIEAIEKYGLAKGTIEIYPIY